jgi:SAM-dependent methyltransferase
VSYRRIAGSAVIAAALALAPITSRAQTTAQTGQDFKPQVGQAGKDVVWVPTDEALVEKMLDMAAVTPQDFVVDLGSGDGRNVIAAARRGARAMGVEYNPDMVALSRRNAAQAGVSDRVTFVEGDMFEADFSKATVLALFLLPDNLNRLRDKFLNLQPGTRIVGNTFGIEGWEPDLSDRVGGQCATWCNALLWIVPARVQGTWKLGSSDLSLTQQYQNITGTLGGGSSAAAIANGKLRGDEIRFSVNGAEYTGRVKGGSMAGTVVQDGKSSSWSATRQ